MKAGRSWRRAHGALVCFTALAGLTFFGLTGPGRADDADPAMPKAKSARTVKPRSGVTPKSLKHAGSRAAAPKEEMKDEATGAEAAAKETKDEAPAAQPRKKEGASSTAKAPASKLDYIDSMMQEAWDQASVKPSKPATDEEFMRRAYLDLVGRIPNIEEAFAFIMSKESGKRAKLVEYLLNHPDFAKNLANSWTIQLVGRGRQERDVDKGALSAWLRRQFVDERPWNDIAFDLITAKGSSKENGACNFIMSHLEFGAVPLTSITARVFLGQQIQCTQCHDHPSNDWKQADFWGINAFFKGIRTERVMTADATGLEVYDHTDVADEPTDAFASYDKRNGLVGIAFPRFLDGRKISQNADVDRRAALGKFIADPKNIQLARAFVNRTWGHLMGKGFVNPIDDFGPHNPPNNPELLDKLAADFQESGFNIKALIRWIMASQAYNLTSATTAANDKDETLFSHMTLKPMTPEQLFDSLLTATSAHKAAGLGDSNKKRDAWLGQFIFTFANDEGEEGSSFSGTIPQALMMMNGELMDTAVGGKPGSFLADLLNKATRQHKVEPEIFMVNHLYIAALSRLPSTRERNEVRKILGTYPDTINVLEDVFWALLNANEFVLNR